ncbi:MAG TPA: ATP-binding protein, partial [Acidobacteriota bacterium]|nr:ATP-binding protein [Acidobacteriota bacterium]
LLENSKKFHPRQLPQITVEAEPAGLEQIKLRITDDGVHLSPEQLERVWTPYYQGEKYFTGQVAGMGLGLPMVAMLIWAAGGSCVLRNRPDQPGIQVELVFPISPSQAKSEDDTVSANHRQP